MKKNIFIGILLIIMLILSSCSSDENNRRDRLLSPTNNTPPIQGKWVIKEKIKIVDNDEAEDTIAIGTEGLFHNKAVILGGDFTTKPSYKIKTVNSLDYLLYKYKLNPLDLDIESDKIQVVTILNENQYFNEFIKYEDNLIVNIDNNFYTLEQKSKEISLDETLRYIEIEKAMIRDAETTETEKKETGVLLGLKIPTYDNKNDLPMWEYKTLWIKSTDKNISKPYELDNLLLPRKTGFSTIDISREKKGNMVEDLINISSDDKSKNKIESSLRERLENLRTESHSPSLKNILFLSNNHISLENILYHDDNRRTLGVYSIDNIKDEKPIKLSDIIGEEGKDIFLEGVQNVISLEDTSSINESNLGLIRKNGYWIFKGRVNYKQNESELYKDFNIRGIPPKEIINFDEHLIPWEAIKRQIPEAIDMYTSPNKEFIIVVTNYNLQIYTIDGKEKINQNAVAKINLPNNASIVMAEWATGRYVDLWEKEVIGNNGRIIED